MLVGTAQLEDPENGQRAPTQVTVNLSATFLAATENATGCSWHRLEVAPAFSYLRPNESGKEGLVWTRFALVRTH
jgi:hypothetical protein